jgi:hypothetical protein
MGKDLFLTPCSVINDVLLVAVRQLVEELHSTGFSCNFESDPFRRIRHVLPTQG